MNEFVQATTEATAEITAPAATATVLCKRQDLSNGKLGFAVAISITSEHWQETIKLASYRAKDSAEKALRCIALHAPNDRRNAVVDGKYRLTSANGFVVINHPIEIEDRVPAIREALASIETKFQEPKRES